MRCLGAKRAGGWWLALILQGPLAAGEIKADPKLDGGRVEVSLARSTDLASRGWFGGEVVIHRTRPADASPALPGEVTAELELSDWALSVAGVPLLQPRFFPLFNYFDRRATAGNAHEFAAETPDWLRCERDEHGQLTEDGSMAFELGLWYSLLNSGFQLVPTAGTSTGIDADPAGNTASSGQARTYVHLPDGFSCDQWLSGLRAGRSFVTNGPSLIVTFYGQPPGHVFPDFLEGEVAARYEAASPHGVQRIELVHNGEVVASVVGAADEQNGELRALVTRSGWLAVRAWDLTPDDRLRLAHTAPVWFDVPDFPALPKARELAWLIELVEKEAAAGKSAQPPNGRVDYATALDAYRTLHAQAR
jgi:hypothetical protein